MSDFYPSPWCPLFQAVSLAAPGGARCFPPLNIAPPLVLLSTNNSALKHLCIAGYLSKDSYARHAGKGTVRILKRGTVKEVRSVARLRSLHVAISHANPSDTRHKCFIYTLASMLPVYVYLRIWYGKFHGKYIERRSRIAKMKSSVEAPFSHGWLNPIRLVMGCCILPTQMPEESVSLFLGPKPRNETI